MALTFDNYSPAFSKRFAGLRDPKRYFERLPELRAAVKWCHDEAPWIHGVVIFGAWVQWRLGRSLPLLELTFPEAVIPLPRDKCDDVNLADFFREIHENYRKRVCVL